MGECGNCQKRKERRSEMKILITGGAGFIGSNTVEFIAKANPSHEVYIVDDFSTGKMSNIHAIKAQFVDICDFEDLQDAFEFCMPDAVLHLAAQSAITTSLNDPKRDLEVNVGGTLNVLLLAKKYGVKRFVFSSTSAVYSEKPAPRGGMKESFEKEPQSPYGISKLAAEHYVRTMFSNHLIVRYGNVYGPRQYPVGENQVIARALQHMINDGEFRVTGDGRQKRDFIHVNDVAYANLKALESDVVGTFNLCTGKSHSVNQVLEKLNDYLPKEMRTVWEYTERADPRGNVYINNSKLKKEFGFMPVIGLFEGLQNTADWWLRENKK